MIRFRVPGNPISQPRQRMRVVRTKGGKTIAANYTPSKHPVNDFKAAVRILASQQYAGPALLGPIGVSIIAVFERPTSKCWKSRPMPREPKTTKPDGDNLAKAVLDALNGVLWRDDSQVADLYVRKFIAAGDEAPHCEIAIVELETL